MKIVELKCPSCLASLKQLPDRDVFVCEYCSTVLAVERPRAEPEQPEPEPARVVLIPVRLDHPVADPAPIPLPVPAPAATRTTDRKAARANPDKSRILTAVLAFVLGLFGIHHFYLGNKKLGLAYLVFFWTYIPVLLGWLEGLSCLFMDDYGWRNRRRGFIVTKKGTIAFVVMFTLLVIIANYS